MGGQETTYTYDPRVRRASGAAARTTYIYDPRARRASGAAARTTRPTKSHLRAPRRRYGGAGRRGRRVYEEYHPYGTSAYRSFGSADVSAKRYRYTGKERDEETGLYYHGARYYMCWLARWASADPLGVGADGPGLYTYVRGSPINFSDPTGTIIPQPGGATKTDPIVIKVKNRLVEGVDRWTFLPGENRVTNSEAEFEKASAGASVIYQYDPGAKGAIEVSRGQMEAHADLPSTAVLVASAQAGDTGGDTPFTREGGTAPKKTGIEWFAEQASTASRIAQGEVEGPLQRDGGKRGGSAWGENPNATAKPLLTSILGSILVATAFGAGGHVAAKGAGKVGGGVLRAAERAAPGLAEAIKTGGLTVIDKAAKLIRGVGRAQHHVFPKHMREFFKKRGIGDVDDFTIDVPGDLHDVFHAGRGNRALGAEYKAGWWEKKMRDAVSDLEASTGGTATREEMMDIAQQLMRDFGVDPAKHPFQRYMGK